MAASLIALGLGSQPVTSRAAEPVQKFIEGLREAGLHDVLIDYLTEMRTSALLTEEIKQTLPYEEAITYIDWAEDDRDPKNKVKSLEIAREKLETFIKTQSANPLAANATLQLGNVIVVRGRMLLESAANPKNAHQKDDLLKQAKAQLKEAQGIFADSEKKFEETFNGLKKVSELPANTPAAEVEKVREARRLGAGNLLQSKLYVAGVLQEMAKTEKPGSKEYKDLLKAAADKYKTVYDKFRQLIAGQLARIKQGQCLQDRGDLKDALGCYRDFLEQPDDLAEIRPLKAAAIYRSQQCWLDPSQKSPELAATKGEEWLKAARADEEKKPDWLAVRYYTSVAQKQLADALTEQKDAAKKATLLKSARDNAQYVARIPGAGYRDEARQLLTSITGKETQQGEPTTFADATERGQMYVDEFETKGTQLRSPPPGTPALTPAQVKELQAEIETARQNAIKYLRLAQKLKDRETKPEEINKVRYLLAFLYFRGGEHYNAALLGEFLSKSDPNGFGRQAAMIALASYLEAYKDRTLASEYRTVDREKMVEIANYIATRWQNEPEADDAWTILMSVAIGESQLPAAREFLAKIPEKSAKRGEAELRLGRALWAAYFIDQRKEESERPSQKQLDAYVTDALKELESGIKRLKENVDSAGVSSDLATGTLSAAQIYLHLNQPDKAVALLEDPKIGPLTLVQKKNPVTQVKDSTLPVEAYKASLRGYIGAGALDKAQAIMGDLEKMIASKGAEGQAELTRIFISMGRALEDQIHALKAAGKLAEVKKVTSSFELFLQKIADNAASANYQSLSWVGETFYGLGAGLDPGGKPAEGEAAGYYNKAIETDAKILALGDKDKNFYPNEDARYAVLLRTARVNRRLGKYKEAVDQIEAILRQKPLLIEGQLEGARSFMEWASQNPLYLNLAIYGARKEVKDNPRSKNVIWGWQEMSNKLSRENNPKLQEAFYESRLNLAICHAEVGKSKQGAEKEESLKRAASTIVITAKVRPGLGGPEMMKKFDDQLKVIQKLQGLPADGLPPQSAPVAQPAPAANDAAAVK